MLLSKRIYIYDYLTLFWKIFMSRLAVCCFGVVYYHIYRFLEYFKLGSASEDEQLAGSFPLFNFQCREKGEFIFDFLRPSSFMLSQSISQCNLASNITLFDKLWVNVALYMCVCVFICLIDRQVNAVSKNVQSIWRMIFRSCHVWSAFGFLFVVSQ